LQLTGCPIKLEYCGLTLQFTNRRNSSSCRFNLSFARNPTY